MNYQEDILDQAEEIYLTEDQFIDWMVAETAGPDSFSILGGKEVLKNMSAAAKRWNQAPPPSGLMLMVERAFGPSKIQKNPPSSVPPRHPSASSNVRPVPCGQFSATTAASSVCMMTARSL